MQFGQRSVRQGSKVAAGPSTCGDWKLRCISDGLASRVKGLTADFWVLLVTNPAPPRRLAVFSSSVATAAKRLWCRQACDFRTTAVPPATIRNQAGHGRSRRQGPEGFCQSGRLPVPPCSIRPPRTCTPTPASSLPIGLENIDDLNAGLDHVAALKAADLVSISPLELHHSISLNDLCPVCRCGAPDEVRVATPV
jgi:hypothetical protein